MVTRATTRPVLRVDSHAAGEFEIDSYKGISPDSRVLAGLNIGNCAACTEGKTEDKAHAVLGANGIPLIDSRRNRRRRR